MFEWDEKDKRFNALHHPFTSPDVLDPDQIRAAPEKLLSKAYDVVLNGSEIGGGSVRIHDQGVQSAVFDVPELMREMVAAGKLGKKSGQGFYEW